MGKKSRTDTAKPGDPDPYRFEREYFPSALIGKALGLHPKYPEPNRAGKGDLPNRVGLSRHPRAVRQEGQAQMTAPKKPRKPGKPNKQDYGPDARMLAFNTWVEAGKPDLRELAEILEAKGLKVNNATLTRWKDANAAWTELFKAKQYPLDPQKVLAALKQAKEDAKNLEADHFLGIKVQLVARLYLTIREMNFATVDDWERALNCCERIEALIHADRGKAVGTENKPASTGVSILAKLTPPVNIAPFKKPSGGTA